MVISDVIRGSDCNHNRAARGFFTVPGERRIIKRVGVKRETKMAVAPVNDLLEEVTNFLAAAPTAEQIVAFKPSKLLDQRLHYLLDQNSADRLTIEERHELDEFLVMSHFLKMLRLKAQLKLTDTE